MFMASVAIWFGYNGLPVGFLAAAWLILVIPFLVPRQPASRVEIVILVLVTALLLYSIQFAILRHVVDPMMENMDKLIRALKG